MAEILCSLLVLAISSIQLVASQGTCRPHDVSQVSECTSGFPSVFHIEEVEGQTDLLTHDSRQVLIPAMKFNCTGRLTKWIFSARWKGKSPAFTELQIWRRKNGFEYVKVGATTVRVDEECSNQLYEYLVDPPLEFKEGDILGYFQPDKDASQLDIYLEDSERIVTRRYNTQVRPSTMTFDLNGSIFGNDYPLIGIETDQPNCGCGFVTTKRMTALLTRNPAENDSNKEKYPQEQAIFPNLRFTCSGVVVKWIMGCGYQGNGIYFPELQIWRPTGNFTYQKLNGTIATATNEVAYNIYEFTVDPPLPVQPGDILGIFQPAAQYSRLIVEQETTADSMSYYNALRRGMVRPSVTYIDINTGNWRNRTGLPLVSVEINTDVCARTNPCPVSELCTNTGPNSFTCTIESPNVPTNAVDAECRLSSLVAGVSVGVLLLLLTTEVVLGVVGVVAVKRKAINGNSTHGESIYESHQSGIGLVTNPAYHGAQPSPTADQYNMNTNTNSLDILTNVGYIDSNTYDYPDAVDHTDLHHDYI